MDNPIEEYIKQKEVEKYGETVYKWVHILKLHYDAAIAEGFTEEQAFILLDMFWTKVDEGRKNNA